MLSPVVVSLVLLGGLVAGALWAYLPWRQGLVFIVASYVTVAALVSRLGQGGFAPGEYEAGGLVMLLAVVGYLLGDQVGRELRRRRRRT